MHLTRALASVVALLASARFAAGQAPAKRPLAAADIDDIARLVMLEDHRQYNGSDLAQILASPHPEVRRRAAQAIGRIADKRGIELLHRPLDADSAVAATAVWAIGQIRDSSTVPWLDSTLVDPQTPPTVAAEAAVALGKIKSSSARDVLAQFLNDGEVGTRDTPAIREALLSIGRSTTRGDIEPIRRWTASPSSEIRWRAVWSLFRPKDPAALPALLGMSKDRSAQVRTWAVRGLTRPQVDSAGVTGDAEKQLVLSSKDPDRSVRTEAIRALGTYSDSTAIAVLAVLAVALRSPDSWISVSAAEGLGRIKAVGTVPQLAAAGRDRRSCALRITALNALLPFAPNTAITLGIEMTRDTVPYCRATAMQTLARTMTGRGALDLAPVVRAAIDSVGLAYRAARRAELTGKSLSIRVAAIRALGTWGDTSDVAALTTLRDAADSLSAIQITTTAAIAAIDRRASGAPPGGRGAGGQRPRPPVGTQTLEDYRRIVERWVVPDYEGRPRPTAVIDTPHGAITVELYPGDAPLATDDFVRTVNAGSMIGTEFTRVVPDFVDQQQTIRGGNTLRDEVNRRGLTRGNLAWATAGLDTGSPGYTLGHTPQPHNEGDFTSLGRVIRGMDAADRIDLGDRITGATMLPSRPTP